MGKTLIYQMLPRLWGKGKFSSVDEETFSYLKSLSITHVWYTGIIRHSTGQPFVKGDPGSPYSISDYYDVNPYMADCESERMAEFESLIKRTHKADLKVIIDFVPNHVSRDYGFHRCRKDIQYLGDSDDVSTHWKPENDYFYYPGEPFVLPVEGAWEELPAKATGNAFTPRPGAGDWFDTVKLNYCDFHTPTWDKMLEIVRFWAAKGVDGFRCDMVELVPMEFFRWLIESIKADYPDIQFIAEVYQKESYRTYTEWVGFDLLYDKSGLYDTLRAIMQSNCSTREITRSWQFLSDLQPRMLNFLENHDEQRFASPWFAGSAEREEAPLAVSLMLNDAPFMCYFGQETGVDAAEGAEGRTSIFDGKAIDSLQRLYAYVHSGKGLKKAEISTLSTFRKAFSLAAGPLGSGTNFDLCYCNLNSEGFNPDRHFAFLRNADGKTVVFACNFSSEPAQMHIRIPEEAGAGQKEIVLEVSPFRCSTRTI